MYSVSTLTAPIQGQRRRQMNSRNAGLTIVAVLFLGLVLGFGLRGGPTKVVPTAPVISDVGYGPAYGARTELCVDGGATMRNWIFIDRWMKNQLTHDTYTVGGRTYRALHIVTGDSTLPRGHVRFRKVVVNIGTGPSLEGHSYLSTLLNGNPAKMEQELLFVEFNGRLERQRRPLPACGTPRS